MADPKPNILQSIVDGTYDPIGLNSSTPSPVGPVDAGSSVPSPLLPAISKPTLGTQDQLTAPAQDAQPEAASGGSWSADGKTLTLPPRTQDNSSEPLAPEDHVGILKTIGRLAGGAFGLTDPNSSPQAAMGARIGALAGRTGNALAEAAGTPEQKQLAEERNQLPLKIAQIQNEMDYRAGVLGAKNTANANTAKKTDLQYGTGANGAPEGTSRITAEAAQENADSNEALRAAHQKQIEASLNGEVYVMPEIAHAIGRPELAGKNMSPIQYQQQVSNVLKSLGVKNQDLGEAGVWGTSPLTGRIAYQGPSPSVARANSMLLRTQLPVNDAQGNTIGWANPQTNSFTPVGSINAKGGGAPLSASLGGNVIPPKPTSSMMTQGQMAQTIQPMIPQIQNEVQQLAQEIGPGAGRWNDYWVNKGGINDPAYAGLNQDLQLFATALGKAHFGASMPEGFVTDMMRDFGTAQSPEDLAARLEHAEGWVNGYAARVGGGNPPAPKKGTTVPNSSTVVEYVRGADGKLHPKGQ